MKNKTNLLFALTIINSILLVGLIVFFAIAWRGLTPSATDIEMQEWRDWVVAQNKENQKYIDETAIGMKEYVDNESKANLEFVNKAIKDLYEN